MERRLAAILAADMVGYSRLVEADETGTIARQKRHRAELIEPVIEAHRGRVVKLTGDGLIAEFPSVVQGVQCAVAIQREMEPREKNVPEDRRIRYRIAVNLGDVIFDDGDVYGDGVNIAARLEALAEPGGVVVSGTAYDHLKSNVEVGYEDLGPQRIKNIATPVRVYRVVPDRDPPSSAPPRRQLRREASRTRHPALAALLGAALAVAAAVLWSWPWGATGPDHLSGPDPRRIAVLPFANISADVEDAYFADGLTEEMISRLSRVRDLSVIARTSAMQYRDTDKGIDEIGRELSVGTVLEGSVRRSGARVRISAQLVDVGSEAHLWSADYDRDLADVFAIQSEIAGAVAEALEVTLLDSRAEHPMSTRTDDLEAYTLYLKGRYLFLNERSDEGYETAISYFERALEIDPDYAPAYAGLANVHANGTWARFLPPAETYPKAKAMAERAIALDPDSADAWYALATTEIEYFWDWEAGERAVARALEIDPGHVLTMSLYSHRLLSAVQGRFNEAVSTMERAVALDPLSLQAHNRFAHVLRMAGELDRAIEEGEETITTWPDYLWPYMGLSWTHSAKGEHDAAIELMRTAAELSDGSSYVLAYLAVTYAEAGRLDDARTIVQELEGRSRTSGVSAAALAPAYAALGDAERMLDALERLYEARHPEMLFIKIGPPYAPYRSDPRFIKLMERVGLPTD